MLGGHPTVQVPPWPVMDEHAAGISPFSLPVSGVTSFGGGSEDMKLAALLRFLLPAQSGSDELADPPVDAYSCDEFRMFEFKVRRCARGRSHDWTDCPFAHPGEKARRRDPRKFLYIGTSCPDFRNGGCKKGDACEFAHGVFESWLHPDRYRTQPCKDGTDCQRRVCFFAHTPEQLRAAPVTQQPSTKSAAASPKLADSYDGSPLRRRASLEAAYFSKVLMSSSPTSTLAPLSDSPPVSPMGARRGAVPAGGGMNEVLAVMKRLRMLKVETAPQSSWELGFGSPKRVNSGLRETSSSAGRGYGANLLDYNLDEGESSEGIVAASGLPDLDVGWVSELVK